MDRVEEEGGGRLRGQGWMGKGGRRRQCKMETDRIDGRQKTRKIWKTEEGEWFLVIGTDCHVSPVFIRVTA